ncbi:MAG: hypothetical protein WBX14_11620 [Candidatus Udaeobacter sp.]
MEIKVELSKQVVAFVARRAPEPRRALRAALRGLARERGDIRALEGPLKDYHRLRVCALAVIESSSLTRSREKGGRFTASSRKGAVRFMKYFKSYSASICSNAEGNKRERNSVADHLIA